MRKPAYLLRNRFGVFVLRFNLPLKKVPKYEQLVRFQSHTNASQYKQILVSLNTHCPKIAKSIYVQVISDVLIAFQMMIEQQQMNNDAQTIDDLVIQFKKQARQLVIDASPNGRLTWSKDFEVRRMARDYQAQLEQASIEGEDKKRMQRALHAQERTISILSKSGAKQGSTALLSDELNVYIEYKKDDWKTRSHNQNISNLVRFIEIVACSGPIRSPISVQSDH